MMKAMTTAVLVAVVGTLLGVATVVARQPRAEQKPGADATSAQSPAGSAEKGRLTFLRVGCSHCHGREAQGSPTTGPRLGPGGLPYAAFARVVRTPPLQMPPYTDRILSDAELADIYAFVQSRPKPGLPSLLQGAPR
jgi:mono/diheme cytochrome c family protein